MKLWITGLGVVVLSLVLLPIEDHRQLNFRWQIGTFVIVVSIALAFYHHRALTRKPRLIVYYLASVLALTGMCYLFSLLPDY
jgi:inner membrane protein involved in colicin E2 resistance